MLILYTIKQIVTRYVGSMKCVKRKPLTVCKSVCVSYF